MVLKVGRDNIFDEKKNKLRPFFYKDVDLEKDGWVDAKKFLPLDFDLVSLKVKGKDKVLTGWSTGNSFDGLRLDQNAEVVFWKRINEQ